jgi:hypothetical protein
MENSFLGSIRNISWKLILVVTIPLVLATAVFLYWFSNREAPATELGLTSEVRQAYVEALELASVYGDSASAIERLNMEASNIATGNAELDLYNKAKLLIYKADIYLTYSLEYERGFSILGKVYNDPIYNRLVRSEAIMLAMAHAFQALDEGALTVEEVRNYVILNQDFADTLGVGVADVLLLDGELEAYRYISRGFDAAMALAASEPVYMLAESYSVRLASPFVITPPTGGFYYDFLATASRFEAALDNLVEDYASLGMPYQEFIATAYYNLARAYESLPPGEISIVDSMARVQEKLAAYLGSYEEAYGGNAYLMSIDARIACKAIDEADFDTARVDVTVLQPRLDRLYASDGWVVPCAEAFELIAADIDARFAEYFQTAANI